MPSVTRKPTGRKPGRPRAGEEVRAAPDEIRALYIDVTGDEWNRINAAVERARERKKHDSAANKLDSPSVSKAGVVRDLLRKGLEVDETASEPKKSKRAK